MIVVIGASGMLGDRTVRRLLLAGEPVRATSRDPERLAELAALGAEVVAADLRETPSIERALEGAEQVVLAAHGLAPPDRRNPPQLVDLEGTRAVLAAASGAGVRHVVHLSIGQASAEHPIDFWRLKAQAEDEVRSSGMRTTILRPSGFVEAHVVAMVAEPMRAKGIALVLGDGRSERNFVSVDDVVEVVVDALTTPGGPDRTVDLVGPDDLTPLEVIDLVARFVDRRVRRIRVPRPVVRGAAAVLRPIRPGIARLLDLTLHLDVHGDAAHPAEEAVVGSTSVEDVVRRWASATP